MKRTALVAVGPLLVLLACLAWQSPRVAAAPQAGAKPALTIADVVDWKTLNGPIVSDDGKWLAYRVSPTEGDSEVVVRQLQGDKEFRFGCGDTGRLGGDLAFSEDGKWVAFRSIQARRKRRS